MYPRRHHKEVTRRQLYSLKRFSDTLCECIFSKYEEWNIGAEPQRESLQHVARQIELPEAVECEQRRCGVGAAAAKARAHRQAFVDLDVDTRAGAGLRFEERSRAHDEVALFRHAGNVGLAVDASVEAQREVQTITPIEQLEDRLQCVIAIGPTARDVQKEIELRRSQAIPQGLVRFDHALKRKKRRNKRLKKRRFMQRQVRVHWSSTSLISSGGSWRVRLSRF